MLRLAFTLADSHRPNLCPNLRYFHHHERALTRTTANDLCGHLDHPFGCRGGPRAGAREKSEAQLRELALKVELTKNKTLGPGRHRRFGGIHQWEGVQSGVLPFRRGDGARRELYAIDATPRAGAVPRV